MIGARGPMQQQPSALGVRPVRSLILFASSFWYNMNDGAETDDSGPPPCHRETQWCSPSRREQATQACILKLLLMIAFYR